MVDGVVQFPTSSYAIAKELGVRVNEVELSSTTAGPRVGKVFSDEPVTAWLRLAAVEIALCLGEFFSSQLREFPSHVRNARANRT